MPSPQLPESLAQRAQNPIDLRRVLVDDPGRAARLQVRAAGLTLDLATQRVDGPVLQALTAHAEQQGLIEARRSLFAGARVNVTEDRAAAHMALRAPRDAGFTVDGAEVSGDVHAVLDAMTVFAEAVRSGTWRGHTGEVITDVVNIGIGGSDLGPRMVVTALAGQVAAVRAHFVANVDAIELRDVLAGLDPARTLFVITSKTFTTVETMTNARLARDWLCQRLPDAAVGQHFVAVSTHLDAAAAFGIPGEQCFGFWDWVGGRYSVWSAVGLSAMIALGPQAFADLRAGAWAMDEHFRDAPLADNLPVQMALVAWWNREALGLPTQVVVPYLQRLIHFVPWLQQLEMESNGKGVRRDGTAALSSTPPLWGDVGTNGQHAFFQMLHQGPQAQPVDFIVAAAPVSDDPADVASHRLLLANALAQRSALSFGKSAATVESELTAQGLDAAQRAAMAPHRVFPGNRPSSLLVMPRLDAFHLGALMAAYEHRTFVLSVLWGVLPFDQWGVELGKAIAKTIDRALATGTDGASLDAATAYWVERFRQTQA